MARLDLKNGRKTLLKLILDRATFIGFLVAMEPRASGIAVHEWLTLSAFGTLMVHLLLNWDWIAQVTKRFLGRINGIVRLNYILNWLLFIDGILIMLSGMMISEVALPALGINVGRSFAWRSLHDLSANLGLLLLGLHTALHWSWVANTFRRSLVQPLGRLFTKGNASRKDVAA